MFIRKRRIVAEDELDAQMTPVEAPAEEDAGEVTVDPEATELLFETDDVAQLVAEVAGQDVDVTVDDETGETIFAVGEDEFTVTPDEDVEVLESTRKPLRNKRSIKASTKRPVRRPATKTVSASRTIKKFPKK